MDFFVYSHKPRLIIFEYLYGKIKRRLRSSVLAVSQPRVFDLLGHFRRSRVYTLSLMVDIESECIFRVRIRKMCQLGARIIAAGDDCLFFGVVVGGFCESWTI